ncbi:hypothetical protein Lal_00024377 [Lupinus albus]|nr:hypothetical protein Lal_00024377 [Lupinus albus]
MEFFLTVKKVAHILNTNVPVLPEQVEKEERDKIAIDVALWKDFKNVLRHKTKKYSLEYLITHLRIEEETRRQDQKYEVLFVSNISTKKKFLGAVLKPNDNNFKNQNRNENKAMNIGRNKNWNLQKVQYAKPPAKNDFGNLFICFKCGKEVIWHRKCKNQPMDHTPQANMIEKPLVAVLTEVTMVGGSDEWWVDTGSSCHVCCDRAMFKTYTNADNKCEHSILSGP